jgi:hypothetical protein
MFSYRIHLLSINLTKEDVETVISTVITSDTRIIIIVNMTKKLNK